MEINNVVVLDDAVDDMVEGRAFYDQRRTGLGRYFWNCILSDIESLLVYAGVHQKHYDLYRLLSKRFPYAVYYEINDNVAKVIAILPLRADPTIVAAKMQSRH